MLSILDGNRTEYPQPECGGLSASSGSLVGLLVGIVICYLTRPVPWHYAGRRSRRALAGSRHRSLVRERSLVARAAARMAGDYVRLGRLHSGRRLLHRAEHGLQEEIIFLGKAGDRPAAMTGANVVEFDPQVTVAEVGDPRSWQLPDWGGPQLHRQPAWLGRMGRSWIYLVFSEFGGDS